MDLASVIDQQCAVKILPDTKKPRAKIPEFIPEECSVRYLLKSCLDIRCVPKKLFIRSLVDFTSAESEKRRLEELCSKQVKIFRTGASMYNVH